MKYEYTLIRSKRRTLSLQIKGDELIVRAPKRISKREIDDFVMRHEEWIKKHRERSAQRKAELDAVPKLSEAELSDLTQKALEYIPARVEYYAANMGLSYGRITLRCQKTRWGSCSSKGNLNFNWKLIMAPPEALDYVVIHELCHLYEFNHSPKFWARVSHWQPDYEIWRDFLRSGWAHPYN